MRTKATPEELENLTREILARNPRLTHKDIAAWIALSKSSEGKSIQQAKRDKKNEYVN